MDVKQTTFSTHNAAKLEVNKNSKGRLTTAVTLKAKKHTCRNISFLVLTFPSLWRELNQCSTPILSLPHGGRVTQLVNVEKIKWADLLYQCFLLSKLCQPLPSFILYSKAKFAYYSRCLLTSYFCIPVPYDEKDIFLGVLVLEGLVGLHRMVQLQLLQRQWLGHRLGLL